MRTNEYYVETLRDGCMASHVGYTTGDTSLPLASVLSEFFFKRQSVNNGARL
jgi:hypothetical protein